MGTIEFFFDYGSPASYLAYTQMPGIAQRTGATIVYRPMLLGGVFKATGNQSPVTIPAKGAWMMTDLPRFAKRYGVPYVRNPHFPINTLNLMRGAIAAEMDGRLVPYSDAIFRAIWVDQRRIVGFHSDWRRVDDKVGLPHIGLLLQGDLHRREQDRLALAGKPYQRARPLPGRWPGGVV